MGKERTTMRRITFLHFLIETIRFQFSGHVMFQIFNPAFAIEI